MRGASTTIGKRMPSSDVFFTHGSNHSAFLLPFSTSSGGGRGSGPPTGSLPTFEFPNDKAPGNPEQNRAVPSQLPQSQPPGAGHGRGKPLNVDPVPPAFSSFLSSIKSTQPGAGRGTGYIPISTPQPKVTPSPPTRTEANTQKKFNVVQALPDDLSPTTSAGRGKPLNPVHFVAKVNEENRHIRVREKQAPKPAARRNEAETSDVKDNVPKPEKGRWKREMNRERERRPVARREAITETDEDVEKRDPAMEAAAKAQMEKFTKHFGEDVMHEFEQVFRDVFDKTVLSPADEEFLDVLHTNYAIEFEPEYLMGEFNQNPDVDEKPPISLQSFIDKIKPFMMVYMQIQSHEEWEEVVQELHKNLPLLKDIVDHYSGPDRMTAKMQEEELLKLANGVPSHTTIPMKSFVDRALVSLQSNPGWKFDKKCQFMSKLVREVQKYK